MATDPKRRQKSLARKAARRKAKHAAAHAAQSAGVRSLSRLSAFPIHECLVPEGLFERGIGNVLVTRRLPSGELACGAFLVNPWCLGVKNAFLRVWSEAFYEDRVEHLLLEEALEDVSPAYAKKLISDAVSYARGLGLAPHPDYRKAFPIFEGIDAAECPQEFSFGHEGKPFFVSGPNDTPARCRQILETLGARLGPEGFHFLLGTRDPAQFREMGFGGEDLEERWRKVFPLLPSPEADPDDT